MVSSSARGWRCPQSTHWPGFGGEGSAGRSQPGREAGEAEAEPDQGQGRGGIGLRGRDMGSRFLQRRFCWVPLSLGGLAEAQPTLGQEGGRVLCARSREGGGRSDGPLSIQLLASSRQSQVTGWWRHTLTATSTDRQQTEVHTGAAQGAGEPAQWGTAPAAARPPCVVAARPPRSPRPGQTMSRGACGGPAG